MSWIISQHTIHDNLGSNFTASDHVDLETGEHKVVAVSRITKPGDWADYFPEDEVARLIAAGAARLPTAEELKLRAMASGASNHV